MIKITLLILGVALAWTITSQIIAFLISPRSSGEDFKKVWYGVFLFPGVISFIGFFWLATKVKWFFYNAYQKGYSPFPEDKPSDNVFENLP